MAFTVLHHQLGGQYLSVDVLAYKFVASLI